jgi:hypothetical protein
MFSAQPGRDSLHARPSTREKPDFNLLRDISKVLLDWGAGVVLIKMGRMGFVVRSWE